ncbi:MAG: flagellar hook capping FlgD N-terminal domain-containing protein [Planctomycetota bacterium]
MSALGGVSAASVSTARSDSSDNDFGSLSNGEFFDIIMTELTAQDPLAPNDTKALIEQISLIRGIESDEKVSDTLTELSEQSSFNSAAGLIGTLVSGVTDDSRRVSDLVTSVSKTLDGTKLNMLDGSRIDVSNVDEVLGAPLLDYGPTEDDDADGDGTDDGDQP